MGWRHYHKPSVSRNGQRTMFSPLRRPLDRLKRCDAFSFIEVMIVVVILAILATLLIPRVIGRTEDAKRAATKAQISNLESALQLYKLDNGNLPSTEQGLKALVERPVTGPAAPNWKAGGYIPKVPVDPWGFPYKYETPSVQGGEFEILSFGADGAPGGEGKNADIVSWDLDRN
jgi:general secretion pathway protein G